MITILLLQVVTCAIMTGIIWIVQVVHYPTFNYLSASEFPAFHRFHEKYTSYIVIPVMTVELSTSLTTVTIEPNKFIHWLSLGCLLLIWICTFFISVPLHKLLSKGKNTHVIERLILTNWIRTALWNTRLGLMFYSLISVLDVKNGNIGT